MTRVLNPATGELEETYVRPPSDRDPGDLSQCHERIDRLCSALDDALPDLNTLTEAAANAEADWQYHRQTALVTLASEQADKPKSERFTVGLLDAMADLAAKEQFREHLLAAQRLRAHREYLHTLRSQLSATQTIAKALGGWT